MMYASSVRGFMQQEVSQRLYILLVVFTNETTWICHTLFNIPTKLVYVKTQTVNLVNVQISWFEFRLNKTRRKEKHDAFVTTGNHLPAVQNTKSGGAELVPVEEGEQLCESLRSPDLAIFLLWTKILIFLTSIHA